jgi:hypothetical protein
MSKIKWYSKPIYHLIAVALVLSPGLVAVPMAGIVGAAGEVTFFSEDFQGGLPASWVVTKNEGFAWGWQDDDPGGKGALGGCSGTFMIADSDYFGSTYGCGQMDTQLWTPEIDCSAYSTVVLEFDHFFDAFLFIEIGDVDVWNGIGWVNKLQYNGIDAAGHVTIDLSDIAAGKTGVRIRWHYYLAMCANYWEVDNVKLSGAYSPAPPPEEVAFISEAFEGGLPGDWAVVNNGGASEWRDDNPLARPALSGCSGKFMIADSAACPPGEFMDTELVTPPIDCSNYSTLRLEFDHYFHVSPSGEVGDVDFWNGTSWVNLLSVKPAFLAPVMGHVVLIIVVMREENSGFRAAPGISPFEAGGDGGVKIRWHYYNASGNSSSFWEVDNVRLSGITVPPVGGEAYPVSKASLRAPWIGVGVLLIGGISWYVLRRRRAQS